MYNFKLCMLLKKLHVIAAVTARNASTAVTASVHQQPRNDFN
jgi:hypothetical protein